MQVHSRQVSSNQSHLHPRLAGVVGKHLRSTYRKPLAAHNVSAYARLTDQLARQPRPLVLDSFCGTGHSTAALARHHRDHLVIGIDKSAQRLGKHPGGGGDNCLLLQADCEAIWQLLVQDNRAVDFHYLFYPNPWPKAAHLQRRVHGHPGFPLLLQLARAAPVGQLQLRSNWQLYVEEFGVAMHLAGCPGSIAQVTAAPAATLFEQKYRQSGHTLWQFNATVAPAAP